MERKLDEKLLDSKLAELERARAWSPRLVSKVEALLRSSDDAAVFRVNPLAFAAERGVPEPEAIDLFLHAAKTGLFDMNWHLLCHGCAAVVESFASLRKVGAAYHCQVCHVDFESTLDDFIEVSFTVAPRIRAISFHDPGSLSMDEYFFRYLFSPRPVYAGGERFVDMVRRTQKVLAFVEPGARQEVETDLAEGLLNGCDGLHRSDLCFRVEGEKASEAQTLSLVVSHGIYRPAEGTLPPGRYRIVVENRGDKRAALVLMLLPAGAAAEPLVHPPYLTGKRALTTQTFRDLFRLETIESTSGLSVKDLTLLFTDLKGSTALYDRIGDLKAFALVQQHFDRLGKVVQQNGGAVVKTIGDAIMATFLTPAEAMRAAIEMVAEIERFNEEHGKRELVLKIGLHRGSTIAVTLNDRLDYFGQTVNIAARVQGLADADEIYVTEDVYRSPGVADLLADFRTAPEDARLRGIQREMRVYRISHRRVVAAV